MSCLPFGSRVSGRRMLAAAAATAAFLQSPVAAQQAKSAPSPMTATQSFVRDPNQPIDEEYTTKIKEYTTEPFFLSPLVDYLPASKTVPTPKAVLGDIAGAPGKLPYSKEVYDYMRLLAKATPAREGLLDRHDRRRARDDRRRRRVGSADRRSSTRTRRGSPSSPIRARST